MHLLPRGVQLPVAKNAVYRAPMGKFPGHLPPLTSDPIAVKDRVERTPSINVLRPRFFGSGGNFSMIRHCWSVRLLALIDKTSS